MEGVQSICSPCTSSTPEPNTNWQQRVREDRPFIARKGQLTIVAFRHRTRQGVATVAAEPAGRAVLQPAVWGTFARGSVPRRDAHVRGDAAVGEQAAAVARTASAVRADPVRVVVVVAVHTEAEAPPLFACIAFNLLRPVQRIIQAACVKRAVSASKRGSKECCAAAHGSQVHPPPRVAERGPAVPPPRSRPRPLGPASSGLRPALAQARIL